jgi:hypothetical protein
MREEYKPSSLYCCKEYLYFLPYSAVKSFQRCLLGNSAINLKVDNFSQFSKLSLSQERLKIKDPVVIVSLP